MQTYETLFITPPDLVEEDEQSTVDLLAKIVTDGGGTFHANERLGRRRLGFPIKKHDDGVYTRFLYDSEKDVPRELERRLRLSDKILRSLTVKLEEDWAEASKKQAVVDAERRAEAVIKAKEDAAKAEEEAAIKAKEDAAKAEAEAAAAAAAPATAKDDDAVVEPVDETAAKEAAPAEATAVEAPAEEAAKPETQE